MRIEDALSQVRTIQMQMARAERCCCYRWATVAVSGLFAAVAAALQAVCLPDPLLDLRQYLTLWIAVAAVSVAVIGLEMLLKWHETPSPHARHQTLAALRQFAPCVAVGAAVTWAIAAACPEQAVLLPGLWASIYSLGIFASAAYLPPGALAVAAYYVAAGLFSIAWGQAEQALAPWTMVATFGVGQSLAAVVLYRRHDQRESEASDE